MIQFETLRERMDKVISTISTSYGAPGTIRTCDPLVRRKVPNINLSQLFQLVAEPLCIIFQNTFNHSMRVVAVFNCSRDTGFNTQIERFI